MKPKEITDQSFQTEVLEASGAVLVFFWAHWCAPCKMLVPLLSEISEDPEMALRVCQLNIEDEKTTFQRYKLENLPAMLLFIDGQYHSQRIGPIPRFALKAWIKKSVSAGFEL